jgi:hypothetical protein
MPSRIGVNADCRALGANRQRFIDFIAALRPAYVLLMDDDKSEIADAIHGRSPETTIIHRKFTVHDGNLDNVPQEDGTMLSPQEYLDFLKTHQRLYVVHQVFNEPAPPKGVMTRLLKWLCELMKLGFEQNMRLCVLNMQSVAIRFDELDAGVYDEFLFCCAKYANFHMIGYHEYGLADVSLNVSEKFMAYLATRGDAVPITKPSDIVPKEAHVGRIQILVDRAKKIGALPLAPLVATEYGQDKVEIRQYQAVIGLNGGAIPYGLPSLRTYVANRARLMTFDDWALEQFMWTDSVIPDYVKGFCWFGWNYNPEWAGFNIGELTPLQALWINYANSVRQTQPVPPVVVPTPVPPPTPPTTEPHAWQKLLTDEQRTLFSRAKAHELSGVEDLILKLGDLLDAAYKPT